MYQNPQYPQGYAPPDPLAAFDQRIRALEERVRTNVVARGFFTRAFTIWGHVFVANLIIGLIVAVISMIVGVIFGASIAAILGPSLRNVNP
jgi:tetrahydromethanopterin S-methyltransferase subunit G